MRLAGEHRVRDPVHALAAHLDQALGLAVHPRRHEVAADARLGARAVGHLGGRVVRTAGAEIRRPPHAVRVVVQQRRQREIDDQVPPVQRRKPRRHPSCHQRDQPRRPQLAERRHQRLAGRVALAEQGGALVGGGVVEQLAQLRLHHRPLFLDDEDLAQPGREVGQPRRLHGERQPHLVEPQTGRGEVVRRQVEPAEDLHQVDVRLARGDDAERGALGRDHRAVDRVDAGEGAHRVELGVQPRLDGQRGQVGPAVVQPVGGGRVAGAGAHGVGVVPGGHALRERVEVDGGAAFDHLRQRREPDPRAREPRQRPAVEPELQHLRHRRGRHGRHAPRLERLVALVRRRGRHAAVVIARDDEHAAVRGGAVGVAVLERVARAVHARPLAIPEREDAFDRALRVGFDALRAEHGGGGQLLVDRGQEADAEFIEPRLRLPHLLIDHAERGAAVAADEAGGVQAALRVERLLHRHQADQRLRAGEEDRARRGPQVVGQAVVGAQGGGGVHAGNFRCRRGVIGSFLPSVWLKIGMNEPNAAETRE